MQAQGPEEPGAIAPDTDTRDICIPAQDSASAAVSEEASAEGWVGALAAAGEEAVMGPTWDIR